MTQAEKLIKIIMPDLLTYLRLKKQGLVAQNRLMQQIPLERREEKTDEFEEINPKVTKNI